MNDVTRREAIRAAAAGIAAVVAGEAMASEPHALGNGACTKCNCRSFYFQLPDKDVCAGSGCKHSFDSHKRIHGPQQVDAAAAVTESYCVAWTKYSKKNGVVKKLGSGKTGTYSTRQEAQSAADKYNADDETVKGVRYYHEARVTNCDPL